MKKFKFLTSTETAVKDATLEIVLYLPLEFNKYNVVFSYYCEGCFGSGCENTDHPNDGCSDCDSTGRISKSIPAEQLSSILDPENLKCLKNTLIALETNIA